MSKDQDTLDQPQTTRTPPDTLPISQVLRVLNTISGLLQGTHDSLVKEISGGVGTLSQEIKAISNGVQSLSQEIRIISNDIKEIKQSIGLINKHIPVPSGRRIRCIFLIHHAATWNVFETIFAAMQKADDFEPLVVTIRHVDERFGEKDGVRNWEEDAHHELTKLSVPHMRLSMDDSYQGLEIIKTWAPDILFRQTPYEAFLPGYQTPALSFTRLCYVSYSFAMPKKLDPAESVKEGAAASYHADLYFHRMCWRIFCETDIHRDMYARAGLRGGDNLVSVGYSKFDSLLESAKNNPPIWPIKNPDGKKRFRIIWAPHHTVTQGVLGFGMFPDIYKDMLAWAKERPDMEFVLRPHPMAFGTFVNTGLMSQADVDAFLTAWDSLPNTAQYGDSEYARLFVASDVLVTDGVGFFIEYQIFLKPLIFMDSQRHTGFNEAGKLVIQSANRVTDVAGARALCDCLQQGNPDPMRELQKKNMSIILPYPGQSGARILDVIRAGLAQERGEHIEDEKLVPIRMY